MKKENYIGKIFDNILILDIYRYNTGKSLQSSTIVKTKCLLCGKEKNLYFSVIRKKTKNKEPINCGCLSKRIKKYNYFEKCKDYIKILSKHGYVQTSVGGRKDKKNIFMHTLIFGEENIPDGFFVDHKNRIKTDNRRDNLRLCTKTQNNINKDVSKKNKSGVIGVYYYVGKWVSYIQINGKSKYLGRFSDKKDATICRLKAEKEYFKDFSPQKHLFKEYGIED